MECARLSGVPTQCEALAADSAGRIACVVLRAGDKVPSVRQAGAQHRRSITTLLRAYLLLASQGLVESRPRSGYFVRAAAYTAPARGGGRRG